MGHSRSPGYVSQKKISAGSQVKAYQVILTIFQNVVTQIYIFFNILSRTENLHTFLQPHLFVPVLVLFFGVSSVPTGNESADATFCGIMLKRKP